MDPNVIECEEAERDVGMCVCKNGPTLDILKEVHRLYEQKMELIDKVGGGSKLQLQVDVLRSWVSDLVGQNTLLARALEELETEVTTKLLVERKKHNERSSKNACGRSCEIKIMNESLIKENITKDREIRQLHKDVQQYEQTILNLRNELSMTRYQTPDTSRKDAEVMAGMCCTGNECGEWEPVKDFTEMLRTETMHFQERIQQMEANLKSSSDSVRALRKLNVSLAEEMHAMRRVCAALVEEGQAASVRAQFKDDIIREMRRQLKQAKAKLKETTEVRSIQSKDFVSGDAECPRGTPASYDSVTIACVRAQPRRKRDVPVRENFQALHESIAKENLLRENLQKEFVPKNIVYGNLFCDNPTSEMAQDFECGHNVADCEDVEVDNIV